MNPDPSNQLPSPTARPLARLRRCARLLAGPPESRRRNRLRAALPLVLVLLGALVLIHPVVATQRHDADQRRLAAAYSARLGALGQDVLGQELESAERYNERLEAAPVLDPWLDPRLPEAPRYQEYLRELDLDEVMGRVTIPSAHVDLPIYHGTRPSVLSQGVGHLFGTSLPVGGVSTHAVLTGRTGLSSATLLDGLVDVRRGDAFYVAAAGRTLKYQVADIKVVLPTETDSLNEVAGRDLVTLVTCTPCSICSHRLLVTGERVPADPASTTTSSSGVLPAPMQTWQVVVIWTVVVVLAAVAAILLRAFLACQRQRRQDVGTGPEGEDGGGGDGGLDPSPGDPGSPLSGGVLENRKELVYLGPGSNVARKMMKLERELTVTG